MQVMSLDSKLCKSITLADIESQVLIDILHLN